ncbi:MAG: hypothetical protein LBK73_02800 [Treponema sp.]|nr:hypothetical protein [Treponema sp.]
MRNVDTAINYLKQHQRGLKINSLIDVEKYLTPVGNSHGVYTHLGWDHIYPDDDNCHEQWMIKTNTRWLIRKKIFM